MCIYFKLRIWLLIVIFLIPLEALEANSLLKSLEYKGSLYIKGSWVDYSLTATFSDGQHQNLKTFVLSIDGALITIPDRHLKELKQINRVDSPKGDVINPDNARIRIFGGDGAKSYQVDIIISTSKFVEMDWRKKPET
jgi:hypothetical protein